jgi:RimJ/RimL family protein N-acetyltransferase
VNPPAHSNLRAWRDADLPAFIALHADPVVGHWLGGAWSEETSRARFEQARRPRDDGLGPWPVVDESDELVGVVGLARVSTELPLHPAVEAAWRLAPRAWGKGLVTSAMRPVLARGFDVAGLDGIVAFTAQSNFRSQAVMRRLGFEPAPEQDFEHPRLAPDHPLRPHVVFTLKRPAEATC